MVECVAQVIVGKLLTDQGHVGGRSVGERIGKESVCVGERGFRRFEADDVPGGSKKVGSRCE
jgi:hypothetical protein